MCNKGRVAEGAVGRHRGQHAAKPNMSRVCLATDYKSREGADTNLSLRFV